MLESKGHKRAKREVKGYTFQKISVLMESEEPSLSDKQQQTFILFSIDHL